MLSLLSTNDSQMFVKSPFNCFSISIRSFPWKTSQDSSAYRNRFDLTDCGMSFTYMRDSNGPRMDPCGTPHVILDGSEQQFSKFTLNNRLEIERYDLNQPMVWFEKPIALNFFNSISWSIVSKAFWKSTSIMPVVNPLSKPFKILSCKKGSHESVEWFFRNPDW